MEVSSFCPAIPSPSAVAPYSSKGEDSSDRSLHAKIQWSSQKDQKERCFDCLSSTSSTPTENCCAKVRSSYLCRGNPIHAAAGLSFLKPFLSWPRREGLLGYLPTQALPVHPVAGAPRAPRLLHPHTASTWQSPRGRRSCPPWLCLRSLARDRPSGPLRGPRLCLPAWDVHLASFGLKEVHECCHSSGRPRLPRRRAPNSCRYLQSPEPRAREAQQEARRILQDSRPTKV